MRCRQHGLELRHLATLCVGLFLISTSTLTAGLRKMPGDSARQSAYAQQDVDTLCAWITGGFSTEMQHSRDSTCPVVFMQIQEVWKGTADGRWFDLTVWYDSVGGAVCSRMLMEVRRAEEGMIECSQYRGSADSGKQAEWFGCDWYLQFSGSNFIGGTHGFACASLPGTAYATVQVDVRSFGVKLWHRGFTKDNELVWGPKEPFLFMRTTPAP